MKIINNIWPEWQIEKEIGQGSYGTVYKCFKNETQEYCAIKVISIPQSEKETGDVLLEKMTAEETKAYYKDIANDLLKEIEILKALKGTKNVVEIYDAQILEKETGIGWNILIRMELLTDFNTYTSDKQLTEKDVIKLGTDLGSALSVCHKAKIIHRDIKPENILVDAEGNFKLSDFGVAKQMEKTQGSMSVKGTYNYMSPEVFAGKKCDGRADMYSLALVMYKLLNNNRLPFIDPNKQIVRYSERQEAFEKRINGEALPKIQGISDELNEVILTACSFKTIDRQRDIDAFVNELRILSKGKSIKLRNAIKYISIAVASVLCIGAIFFGVKHFIDRPQENIEPDEIIVESAEEETTHPDESKRTWNDVVTLSAYYDTGNYRSDGQYLLADNLSLYNSSVKCQYYIVDADEEKYTNINSLIKEDGDNLAVWLYDDKYIYYSLAEIKNENDYPVESGYDYFWGYNLYRYNRKTKEKELILTSDVNRLANVLYYDNESVYIVEDEGAFDAGQYDVLYKYSLNGKKKIPIGYGTMYVKSLNGYLIYISDQPNHDYNPNSPLWVYDTISDKSFCMADDVDNWHINIISETEIGFIENDIIKKYNLNTNEKTEFVDLKKVFSDDSSYSFSKNYITENYAYINASKNTDDDELLEENYFVRYDDLSYKVTYSVDWDTVFYDKQVSDNILFTDSQTYSCRLYKASPNGNIEQMGGDIYFIDFADVRCLGTKLAVFTDDDKTPIKFYDFWDYEENEKVTFKEYDDDDPEKVFLIISDADVRVGPGKVYEKIGLLKRGYTSANLIATGSNGWSRITYNDADVDSNNIVAYIETENIVRVSQFLSAGNCGMNAKWSVDEATQTLSISGKGDMFELTGYVGSDYCVPWLQCAPNIKMVKIENGITSIGSYSFNYCNSVTSVDISESVTKIGDNAFSSCVNLTDIYYGGTEEQWDNCYMGSEEDLDGVTIHYNSE